MAGVEDFLKFITNQVTPQSPPQSAPSPMAAMSTPRPNPMDQEQQFMQQFLKNRRDDPDALYQQYQSSSQLPKVQQTHEQDKHLFTRLMNGVRNLVPFVDSGVGHGRLEDTIGAYPYTPSAAAFMSKHTLVRDSMKGDIAEYEADTDPEKILGLRTGRDKMNIATQPKYTQPNSVVNHELMHSYLDNKGYPRGEANFQKTWESGKQKYPLLNLIDQFIASSPDYKDEMNRSDINHERFAYLAQALGGGGLQAFPPELQPDYAPIYRRR